MNRLRNAVFILLKNFLKNVHPWSLPFTGVLCPHSTFSSDFLLTQKYTKDFIWLQTIEFFLNPLTTKANVQHHFLLVYVMVESVSCLFSLAFFYQALVKCFLCHFCKLPVPNLK
jgi:hypothetical protein